MIDNNELKNKFYCPEHQRGIEIEANGEIYCQTGKHYLALEFPPKKAYLEYCCGCQRFIPFSITGELKETACLSCEKEIERRYFCLQCQTLTNDVEKKVNDKKFTISAEGEILPNCPACGFGADEETLHSHKCETLKTGFYTSRMKCIFCRKNVFQVYEDRIRNLQGKLEVYENLSDGDGEIKNIVAKVIKKIKAVEEYQLQIYSYLKYFEPKLRALSVGELSKLNEIDEKFQELNNKIDFVSSSSLSAISLNEISKHIPQYVPPPLEQHLLKGSVADIHIRCGEKENLTKYPPHLDALKSITSGYEIVSYYGVLIEDGGIRHYAIPVATRIGSDSEARTLFDFYSIDQSRTSRLNGKLIIVKPARIRWDEEIHGWRLYDKGVMKIES